MIHLGHAYRWSEARWLLRSEAPQVHEGPKYICSLGVRFSLEPSWNSARWVLCRMPLNACWREAFFQPICLQALERKLLVWLPALQKDKTSAPQQDNEPSIDKAVAKCMDELWKCSKYLRDCTKGLQLKDEGRLPSRALDLRVLGLNTRPLEWTRVIRHDTDIDLEVERLDPFKGNAISIHFLAAAVPSLCPMPRNHLCVCTTCFLHHNRKHYDFVCLGWDRFHSSDFARNAILHPTANRNRTAASRLRARPVRGSRCVRSHSFAPPFPSHPDLWQSFEPKLHSLAYHT